MGTVTWNDSTAACTAMLDGEPVCTIKSKDIGGWTAIWAGDRKWAAPAHLPKAMPQESKFFVDKESAKLAIEQALSAA